MRYSQEASLLALEVLTEHAAANAVGRMARSIGEFFTEPCLACGEPGCALSCLTVEKENA